MPVTLQCPFNDHRFSEIVFLKLSNYSAFTVFFYEVKFFHKVHANLNELQKFKVQNLNELCVKIHKTIAVLQ